MVLALQPVLPAKTKIRDKAILALEVSISSAGDQSSPRSSEFDRSYLLSLTT